MIVTENTNRKLCFLFQFELMLQNILVCDIDLAVFVCVVLEVSHFTKTFCCRNTSESKSETFWFLREEKSCYDNNQWTAQFKQNRFQNLSNAYVQEENLKKELSLLWTLNQ